MRGGESHDSFTAMTAPVRYPLTPAQPHRFTTEDVLAMVHAGVLQEGAKVELIQGELVDMAGEGALHTDWVYSIGRWLYGGLGPEFIVVPGSTLILSSLNAPKPDWWVFHSSLKTADVRGPDLLLAIEVAQSSLSRDLGEKAALYAAHGVRDYWVAHVETRQLYVHRDPAADGYGYRQRFEAADDVEALLLPGVRLRLASLDRAG